MLNVVIFGAPGSGKGTQSELIIKQFGLRHISTGEILRAEIQSQTELGTIAGKYIDKGRLLPDDLIIDMLTSAIKGKENAKGLILDGFPRTIPQAEALKSILSEAGAGLAAVLDLQVEEAELIKRLLERGKRMGRSDDKPETIKSRLDEYRLKTAPLVEYYTREKIHYAVEGSGTVEKIFEQIKEIISSCRIS